MIVCQTKLVANGKLDQDGLRRLVNSLLEKHNLSWDGKATAVQADDIILEIYPGRERMGFMLSEASDGTRLKTSLLLDTSSRELGIRVSLSSETLPFVTCDAPEILRQLICGGYLKNDNRIPWPDGIILIDDQNYGLLADVINGTPPDHPLVFVSRRQDWSPAVDVGQLVKRVSGLAHVMVIKDRKTERLLREACVRLDYGGAVGLYLPDGSRKTYLPGKTGGGSDAALLEKTVRKVFLWENTRPLPELLTWEGLHIREKDTRLQDQGVKLAETAGKLEEAENRICDMEQAKEEERRMMMEEAVSKAKSETEKLIAEFDEEMDRLKDENEQIKKENRDLLYENKAKEGQLKNQGTPLVFAGNETDLFPGEIKDIVMSALKEYLKTKPKGRRQDVISDLLEANGDGSEITNRAETLKKLMCGLSRMDKQTRRALEDLGFEISDDGRHYRLAYCGDSRYTETVSKSPSDYRGVMNTVQEMIKTIY